MSLDSGLRDFMAKVKLLLRNIFDGLLKVDNNITTLNGSVTSLSTDVTSLAKENTLQSIDGRLTSKNITPNILSIGSGISATLSVDVHSISFSNTSKDENVLVLGQILPPGMVITFDAGALNNKYISNSFSYDTQNGSLLIVYNS